MSIIDNAAHSVIGYTGKEKAFTGQRLAKFSWKTVTDKSSALYNVKRDSKCVSLPVISNNEIMCNNIALVPHIAAYLHSVQDKIIRERLESGNNVTSITNEEINISAICEYLDGSDESGRLTKEAVGTWFDSELSDSLALALSLKLGISDTPTDEQSAKILAVVAEFKKKISGLAGGKTSYAPAVCTSIITALELVGSGDVLAQRFTGRLNKMIADSKAGDDLLLSL